MKTRIGLFSVAMVLLCVCATAQDAPSGAFAGLVSVNASLKSTVSSKDAKVGQAVMASLENPATVGGTALPRGSMLVGHVVEVTKHTKETPDGSLTIVFDEVKPKKGDAMKIRASIFKIWPSENMMLAQRRDVSAGMRGEQNDVNTAVMRQQVERDQNTVHATQSDAGAPVQVVSGIDGVALSAVASDDKSGVMMAKNKDVELPVSMDMVIGVALKQ